MFESRFQSFADDACGRDSAERLAALRAELARREVDGFIAPRADEHQNEYVPRSAERLAWLTGFTGSAGVVVVLTDKAALFVDGRYTLQAPEQVDAKRVAVFDIAETAPSRWLAETAKKGARIGYDPWVHTQAQIDRYAKALEGKGVTLAPLDGNPIDAVWSDRPAPPCGAISLYPPRLAGVAAKKKIARVRKALGEADALLVSDPHALAWLFNLRGADVAHTPIALGFALLPKEGRPLLYVDPAKLSPKTRAGLEALADIREAANVADDLAAEGARGRTILFDSATAPAKLVDLFRGKGGQPKLGEDPIALLKAVKNEIELDGARAAHLRDGVALTRFLAWFAETAPKGRLTEISAAQALETFRRESGELRDLSFPTISAFGPHAAIPHYRVTEASDLRIARGVYLVDSGAQYLDGTTDVTRTIGVGRPSKQLREHFTRVLQGHIGVARAVFPAGVSGAQLDAFARRSLWEAGLDFDHGVGHGVGAYLSVHEGPQRISKLGTTPLQPGMILSDEPGYYRAGEYGVRLENLIVVEKREIAGAEREMLGFETLTLAPFDLALVEPKLMSAEETRWLNAYHARVRAELSPHLDAKTRKWLTQATRKL
ncbi:aminopeptidase P family protein [Methylosinus sp. Ce-a6]|uniref:aminopeptidase P family protein n=1 Tax=Methylosinus sp. Ce-a6 TaxID=2172005 RepID=UPI001357A8F8|nr:aminopeptidase P family protein [Methylosinus sp. Ce-a6]